MRQRTKRRHHGLDAAISAVGTMTRLAELLTEAGKEITVQGVADWERVPSTRCLDVEQVTGVSRHVLRPDIYGAEPKSKGKRPKPPEFRVA